MKQSFDCKDLAASAIGIGCYMECKWQSQKVVKETFDSDNIENQRRKNIFKHIEKTRPRIFCNYGKDNKLLKGEYEDFCNVKFQSKHKKKALIYKNTYCTKRLTSHSCLGNIKNVNENGI